jgi:hypothetical protein
MTHTPDELKAAMAYAAGLCEEEWRLLDDPNPDNAYGRDCYQTAAILRAYLESFDEERALLEAAEKFAAYRRHIGVLSNGTWDEPFDATYRVLVAKREGKEKK